MATFEVHVDSDLPAPEAWRRLLDLRAHTAVIPLTTLAGDVLEADQLVDGSRFVARTGIGPLAVNDAMVVESIVPPTSRSAGTVRIRKRGKVVRGRIELRVVPTATGSRVHWSQRIGVRGVPRLLDPAVSRVARRAYGRALRQLLARA
jgi:carbon monoxide dehydrogenase subunit G